MVVVLSRQVAGVGVEGAIDVQVALGGKYVKDGQEVDLSPEVMNELIDSVKGLKSDIASDYEHLALRKESTPEMRKASGWMTPDSLEVREGDEGPELWVRGWKPTPPAKQHLSNDEFRYPSIAFAPRKDGRPARFINFTLTNQPFLDGVSAIECSRETKMSEQDPKQTDDAGKQALSQPAPEPEKTAALAEPPTGDTTPDAQDSADLIAAADMLQEGAKLDRKALIAWLMSNADRLIAEMQQDPVEASTKPAEPAASSAPAEDEEKKAMQAELSRLKVENENLALLSKAQETRIEKLVERVDGDAEADAKKKIETEAVLFARALDEQITACRVHVDERENAIALFNAMPDRARAMFLARKHTVVPTKPAPAERITDVAPAMKDGKVVIELNRLNEASRAAFNSLVANKLLSREEAFTQLLARQAQA